MIISSVHHHMHTIAHGVPAHGTIVSSNSIPSSHELSVLYVCFDSPKLRQGSQQGRGFIAHTCL